MDCNLSYGKNELGSYNLDLQHIRSLRNIVLTIFLHRTEGARCISSLSTNQQVNASAGESLFVPCSSMHRVDMRVLNSLEKKEEF